MRTALDLGVIINNILNLKLKRKNKTISEGFFNDYQLENCSVQM